MQCNWHCAQYHITASLSNGNSGFSIDFVVGSQHRSQMEIVGTCNIITASQAPGWRSRLQEYCNSQNFETIISLNSHWTGQIYCAVLWFGFIICVSTKKDTRLKFCADFGRNTFLVQWDLLLNNYSQGPIIYPLYSCNWIFPLVVCKTRRTHSPFLHR